MSKTDIVDRIAADAAKEAQSVIDVARETAEQIIAEAEQKAKDEMAAEELTVKSKCKAIADGREAFARLDSAKILLAEKRRVIDTVYNRALEKLLALKGKDCVALCERLLNEYAEEGDEILFADGFAYKKEVAELKAVKEKNLKISFESCGINGGLMLRGKKSDKDLSYGALLAADRAENEAQLAARLFSVD